MSNLEATAGRGSPSLEYDREPAERLHAAGGLVSKRIVVGYGFWIFLLSDIIMFSAFFATYAVLVGQTAGGPSGRELFDLSNTGVLDADQELIVNPQRTLLFAVNSSSDTIAVFHIQTDDTLSAVTG